MIRIQLICLVLINIYIFSYAAEFFHSFGSGMPYGSSKDDEYYRCLGVDKSASLEQIKRAYRKQAMISHPDKGGDAEQFKKLNEAYEILSDSEKRSMYDKYGKEGLSGRMGASNGSPFGFGDLFRGFAGFAMPVMMQLDLSLEDLYVGKEISISIRGDNYVKIKIEPGMQGGQQLVARGQLIDSKGSPRDLIFTLNEMSHPIFKRKNADLLMDLKISLSEALLGFEKAVKHLDGKEIWIKSRKGEISSPDDILMLNDLGMPIFGRPTSKGKLYIRIKIEFPRKMWLDEFQLKALERLLAQAPSSVKPRKRRAEEPVVHASREADLRSFGKSGESTSFFSDDEEETSPFSQFFFR